MGETPTWEEAKSAAKVVPAEESGTAVKPAQQTESSQEKEPAEKEVDYKAELEKYKIQAEKAQKIADKHLEAIKRLQKSKERPSEEEPEGESNVDESTDIEALIEEKTTERLNAFQREQTNEVIDETLNDLTDNEDERALIRAIYESEIKPTGFKRSNIVTDLKKAFLIANAERFEAMASKKAEAKIKKNLAEEKASQMSQAGAVTVGKQPPQVDTDPVYNEKEQSWMNYLKDKQAR